MNLNPSIMQTICWVVVAICVIIGALATYSANYYGRVAQQQEKASFEQRILDQQKKSETAIIGEIKNLKDEVAKLQKDNEKELTSQFPAAYQAFGFGVIDKQVVPSAKPSTEEVKISWATAKILSVTKNYIDIMLPDAEFPRHIILQSNTVRVENKEGAISSSGFVIGDWSSFVKILKSDEKRVIAVVGYVRRTN